MRVKPVSACVAALVVSTLAVAAGAAPDRRPPRIVAAAIVDTDRDARADAARLTYSERVRHAADRDGTYPFTVAGYRIRSVGAARGKTLLLLLVEQAAPDPGARPLIRYRRTAAQPVRDRRGQPGTGAGLPPGARPRHRAACSRRRHPRPPRPRQPSAADRQRRRRHARRPGLRSPRRGDPSRGRRPARPRLRRLQLRRDRRHREGCGLRLGSRQRREPRHESGAEAADPGRRHGRDRQRPLRACHRGRRTAVSRPLRASASTAATTRATGRGRPR